MIAEGRLDVGDGQRIHWEEHGAPYGVPAVILHGGPGSGSSALHRSFFDDAKFRIIQFDQRGCGQSTPHASDLSVGLDTNTLGHLLRDLEALRVARGVEEWVVFGMSFGTTLGLAYAQTWPARVRGLVLAGATLSRPSDLEWLYRTIAPLYPVEYARFVDGLTDDERADVIETYYARVNDADRAVRAEFARRWTEWDWATASVRPSPLSGKWADPAFQLARARICTHFFARDLRAAGEQLVRPEHLARLNQCDGVILNGRLDLQCPLAGALELHALWPRAELVIVDDAGHSVGDAGMPAAIGAALDRFAAA